MDRERRKDQRAVLRLPVRYRVLGASMDIWYTGTVENISAGGVNLMTEQVLEGQDEVELEVTLPSRKNPYLLKGQVVSAHSAPSDIFAYGVSFTDAGTSDRFEVESLVRFLLPRRSSE